MGIQIYYFSGTGNSLHVARVLAKRLPETTLVPIVNALKNDKIKASDEIIGLIFPIYHLSVPLPVKQFLQKIDLQSTSYIFAVATRGGSPCRVFLDIKQILKKKGKSLDACFYIEMPNNYMLWTPHAYEPETQETIMKNELEMQRRLDLMRDIIINKKTSRENDHIRIPFYVKNILFPFLTFIAHITRVGNFEKNFYSNSKCTGCGICGRVCLAEKIKMDNGRPIWRKDIKCLFCFACINYCPVRAIQIKNTKTEIRHRYHHPEISPDEIARQKEGFEK